MVLRSNMSDKSSTEVHTLVYPPSFSLDQSQLKVNSKYVSMSIQNHRHKKILDSLALFVCELTSELDYWKTCSSHKTFASLPSLVLWKDTNQTDNKQAPSRQNDCHHLTGHASHPSSYLVSSLPPMIPCPFLI